MSISKLEITRYVTSSGPYHTEEVFNPSWHAIANSITKLDRDVLPFVWLYTDIIGENDHGLPQFEVLGGDGTYVVLARVGGKEMFIQDQAGLAEPVIIRPSNIDEHRRSGKLNLWPARL